MAAPDKAWWRKAADQMLAAKRGIQAGVKAGAAEINERLVPGEKKVSDMPGDLRKIEETIRKRKGK